MPTNPASEVAIHFIRQIDGRFECADPFATTGHYVEVQTVAKMEAERDEARQHEKNWQEAASDYRKLADSHANELILKMNEIRGLEGQMLAVKGRCAHAEELLEASLKDCQEIARNHIGIDYPVPPGEPPLFIQNRSLIADYEEKIAALEHAVSDLKFTLEIVNSGSSTKEISTLTADLAAKDAEIKILRMQLAGCGAAALANTHESAAHRLTRDNPYWSASYGDVCRAVDREIELREALDRPVIANAVAESQLTALRTACEAVLTWYENDGSIDGAYKVMGNLTAAMASQAENDAPSPAAADEQIVVGGREVNVQSKWLGGDPPFVVTDGKCEGLDGDGQWSNKLPKMKEFRTHESATEFARKCAESEPTSIARTEAKQLIAVLNERIELAPKKAERKKPTTE
jgi:hypothetical protein